MLSSYAEAKEFPKATLTLPPGPKGLPFAGHLFTFRRDPVGFLQKAARDYGDIVYFKVSWHKNGINIQGKSVTSLRRDFLMRRI